MHRMFLRKVRIAIHIPVTTKMRAVNREAVVHEWCVLSPCTAINFERMCGTC